MLWLGVFGSGVAYLIFFGLLARRGAGGTSVVAYLLPVFGVALGALVLSEPVDAPLLAGLALIVAGIALVNSKLGRQSLTPAAIGRRRRPPERVTMRTDLGAEDVGDLLEQPLIAVLATRRKDDTIMLSPVWFEWLEGGINIWVPTPEGGKVGHIRRDPRVTVVVANQVWPYKGFELRGEATVSTTPSDFYGVLRRTALRYDGPGGGRTDGLVVRAGRRDPGRARRHPGVGLRGRGVTDATARPDRTGVAHDPARRSTAPSIRSTGSRL